MTKSPLTPYANTHSLSLADWLDDNKSKPRAALSPLERITATGYPLPPIRAWASALKVMWAAPEIWDVEMRAGKAASLGRVALALSEASAHHAIVPTDRQQQRDTARAVVLAAIAGLSPTDVACVATGGSQFTTRSLLRARMLVMRTPTPTVSENQVGAEAIAALARAFGIDVVVVPNEHRSPEDFTFHVQPLSTQYPKVEPKLEVDVLW